MATQTERIERKSHRDREREKGRNQSSDRSEERMDATRQVTVAWSRG